MVTEKLKKFDDKSNKSNKSFFGSVAANFQKTTSVHTAQDSGSLSTPQTPGKAKGQQVSAKRG